MFEELLKRTLFIRHFLFLYLEIKRAIALRKTSYIDTGSIFIEQFKLRFLLPYLDFFKSKFLKNKIRINFKNKHAEIIYQNGFTILPPIKINEINFVKLHPDPAKHQRTDNFVNVNEAYEFSKRHNFIQIVSEYFQENQCNFTSTSWNTNPFIKASGVTKFHRDRDGLKELKIFIYLTDTCENTGPHVYAVNSHKIKFFKFIPQYRYEDKEVKYYYENLVTFCGKKGYCVAEDTTGLHKGTPPISNSRTILELAFYTGKVRWTKETIKINL